MEEQMCDRLVAGVNNLSLQRKLLEKKDLTFAEARKICEQHDDLMKTTSSEAVTLFQRQKTPPNRPSTAKRAPKPQKDSPVFFNGAYRTDLTGVAVSLTAEDLWNRSRKCETVLGMVPS
ncbi:unnamed protein product [Echinostoma caproni]|uniref:Uncharacterized protein n=1 Tax=Echinostoma caproni TaxID=27848 RepID=A0A3P8LDK0_9TREM|nr:unnamed protein product [Echinostoma caproni]